MESSKAEPIVVWLNHKDKSLVKIFIEFEAHYGEPSLTISFDPHKEQR